MEPPVNRPALTVSIKKQGASTAKRVPIIGSVLDPPDPEIFAAGPILKRGSW
jgi:hypothetical protein